MDTIIFFLFFIDLNGNNLFDSNDTFSFKTDSDTVYCSTIDTNELKPCWYVQSPNIKDMRTDRNNASQITDKIFFLKNVAKSRFYLVNSEWKIKFTQTPNEQEEIIYYSDDGGEYESTKLQKYYIYIWLLILISLWIWVLLFPKKSY